MENFVQSNSYTEFQDEFGGIWVFGDTPENIDEDTPHQYAGQDNNWGDGTEEEIELPITDGHGQREYVTGKFYVGKNYELLGTSAETNISEFYKFNYETI